MTHKHTFKSFERLKSRKAIGQLFAQGQSHFVYPFKLYYNITCIEDASEGGVQMAVSVPKSKIRSAVDRNLLKRRTREAYRLHNHALKELVNTSNIKLDLMFVYIDPKIKKYPVIESSIKRHLSVLQKTFLLVFCSLIFNSLMGQVYLQLERFNNPKSVKFHTGQTFEFRLKKFPKTWRAEEIIDLKADQQLIVLEDSYYHPDDFSLVRRRFPTVRVMGERLMQFSAAWFVYGGVATVASDNYSMSDREIIYGATAALTGYLLREFFSKKRVKINKRRRLRVMDTRMDPRHGF